MALQQQTKESLLARTETLCNAIHDERNPDPHGGDGYLSTILRAARMRDTSDYSAVRDLGEQNDYYTSAQKELTIRDATMGLVKTVQELSSLIREVQELWLFGGLDTLRENGVGEEDGRVGEVAGLIERLAKGGRKDGNGGKESNGVKEEGEKASEG